jgi:hypothetical protein
MYLCPCFPCGLWAPWEKSLNYPNVKHRACHSQVLEKWLVINVVPSALTLSWTGNMRLGQSRIQPHPSMTAPLGPCLSNAVSVPVYGGSLTSPPNNPLAAFSASGSAKAPFLDCDLTYTGLRASLFSLTVSPLGRPQGKQRL